MPTVASRCLCQKWLSYYISLFSDKFYKCYNRKNCVGFSYPCLNKPNSTFNKLCSMNFVLGFHSWICFGSLPLFSLSCCFCSFPSCSKLYELAYILFERRLNIFQTLTYKLNTMPNTVLPEPGVHGHKTGSKLTGRKKEGER